MRVLKLGVQGNDVVKWQNFLIGYLKAKIVALGYFDADTLSATIQFQVKRSLTADGIVGQKTYMEAFKLGFVLVDEQFELQASYPKKPANIHVMSDIEKENIFGKFSFVPAPTPDNPEAIKIIDNWAQLNIVTITIPELGRKISCHKLAQKQILSVFKAWGEAGLINKILTWNGCWNARFKRGSRVSLSNHSLGCAFDINAQWNKLGAEPAKPGQKGCIYELVEIAYEHGFFWGGHFNSRLDGMHFEIFKLI